MDKGQSQAITKRSLIFADYLSLFYLKLTIKKILNFSGNSINAKQISQRGEILQGVFLGKNFLMGNLQGGSGGEYSKMDNIPVPLVNIKVSNLSGRLFFSSHNFLCHFCEQTTFPQGNVSNCYSSNLLQANLEYYYNSGSISGKIIK